MQQVEITGSRVGGGKLYHPLLNVPLPTVADLRSRCADITSIQVLDAACQLATVRCRGFEVAQKALLDYTTEPYFGESLSIGAAPNFEISEADIVRALLAIHEDFLKEALFCKITIRIHPSALFCQLGTHWKATLDGCSNVEAPVAVANSWARRCAVRIFAHRCATAYVVFRR